MRSPESQPPGLERATPHDRTARALLPGSDWASGTSRIAPLSQLIDTSSALTLFRCTTIVPLHDKPLGCALPAATDLAQGAITCII